MKNFMLIAVAVASLCATGFTATKLAEKEPATRTAKPITVPASNEQKTIVVVQLWGVRWTSRHSEFASGTQPELEAFPTELEAEEFATSLRQAFELIKHTSGNEVTIKRMK